MPKMTKRKIAKTEELKITPKRESAKAKEGVAVQPKNENPKQIEVSNTGERFYFKASDDFDRMPSHLICHSNNGSDHTENTLSHARSKKLKKPILIEIDSEQKFPNYSLTVSEARELRDTLTRMIDYLEEV